MSSPSLDAARRKLRRLRARRAEMLEVQARASGAGGSPAASRSPSARATPAFHTPQTSFKEARRARRPLQDVSRAEALRARLCARAAGGGFLLGSPATPAGGGERGRARRSWLLEERAVAWGCVGAWRKWARFRGSLRGFAARRGARLCLTALVALKAQALRGRAAGGVADGMGRDAICRHYLSRWARHAEALGRARARAASRGAARLLAAARRALQEWWGRTRALQERRDRAVRQGAARLLGKGKEALEAWAGRAEAGKRRRDACWTMLAELQDDCERAEAGVWRAAPKRRWRRQLERRVLQRWARATLISLGLAALARRAARASQWRALRGWMDVARREVVMAAMAALRRKSGLRKALRSWLQAATEAVRDRRCAHLVATAACRRQACWLRAWRRLALASAWLKRARLTADSHLATRARHRTLRGWRAETQRAAAVRLAARRAGAAADAFANVWETRRAGAALRAWLVALRRRQRNERAVLGALARRRPSVLRPALGRWQRFAVQEAQLCRAVRVLCAGKALRYLHEWRLCSSALRIARARRAARAAAWSDESRRVRALHGWALATRLQTLSRFATAFDRARRARAALRHWRRAARLLRTLMQSIATEHRQGRLLRTAFAHWLVVALAGKRCKRAFRRLAVSARVEARRQRLACVLQHIVLSSWLEVALDARLAAAAEANRSPLQLKRGARKPRRVVRAEELEVLALLGPVPPSCVPPATPSPPPKAHRAARKAPKATPSRAPRSPFALGLRVRSAAKPPLHPSSRQSEAGRMRTPAFR